MMKTFKKVIEIKVCTGKIYCFEFKVKCKDAPAHPFRKNISIDLEANHMGHFNMSLKRQFECSRFVFVSKLNETIDEIIGSITSTIEERFFSDLNEFDKQLYQLGFEQA